HFLALSSLYAPPALLTLFFFTTPATPEIYTLSLHDALPISVRGARPLAVPAAGRAGDLQPGRLRPVRGAYRLVPGVLRRDRQDGDRKSTRLNSSHRTISYAVFCLKKKKKNKQQHSQPQCSTT